MFHQPVVCCMCKVPAAGRGGEIVFSQKVKVCQQTGELRGYLQGYTLPDTWLTSRALQPSSPAACPRLARLCAGLEIWC